MNKTFNIYCDESTHLMNDGCPYMVFGYVSIAYPQIKQAKNHIKDIRKKYNYTGELKWTNIHEATYHMYAELVEYFFMTDIQFRAVIVKKDEIDETRSDFTFNDFYFRMYYQLLSHNMDLENSYNVYFDIKDTCSHEKLHKLQDILKWNNSIQRFQFLRSHESCFVQLADVLMGAINYNLRINIGNIEGKSNAKKRIVEKIKNHVKKPIIVSTPKSSKKFNLFFISLK